MGSTRHFDGPPLATKSDNAVAATRSAGDSQATLPAPPGINGGQHYVPGYAIVAELGRGGMGVVYHAVQTTLQRTVALKMVLSGGHAGPKELARFRTEATALASLQHPNIVQVYDFGEHNGLPYFSLEFCGGGNLIGLIRGDSLSPPRAAELVETLARAVAAAHRAGIIHRDLKPANVLLTTDGTPKVADFGLAKTVGDAGLTASGAVMGTPSYMAPEQARGDVRSIGPATDIYALGAILYECLTGQPPFRAESVHAVLSQVINAEPRAPSGLRKDVPRDLETICLKCLNKSAAGRYASADELADELDRFRSGAKIRTRRPLGGALVRLLRRHPRVAALAAAGIATACLFAVQAMRAPATAPAEAPVVATVSLQGTWKLLATDKTGTVIPGAKEPGTFITVQRNPVNGNWECVVRHTGGEFKTRFIMDTTTQPMTQDIDFLTGEFAGKRQYGISKIEGDRWTVITTAPGSKPEDRPTNFDASGPNRWRLVWERVKDGDPR